MKTVSAGEAKGQFSTLLNDVERGEEVTITRHGRPVAKLVPARPHEGSSLEEALDALKQFRRGRRLEGVTIRELIEEGRRY